MEDLCRRMGEEVPWKALMDHCQVRSINAPGEGGCCLLPSMPSASDAVVYSDDASTGIPMIIPAFDMPEAAAAPSRC